MTLTDLVIDRGCTCKDSTGSTKIECCNICGHPLDSDHWHFNIDITDIKIEELTDDELKIMELKIKSEFTTRALKKMLGV